MTDHLTPIEPESAVDAMCKKIAAAEMCHTTSLELLAFRETRTPHDGRRLVKALRNVEKHTELADELEAIIKGSASK